MDDTDRVRELQDKVADLQAEVRITSVYRDIIVHFTASVCKKITA